MTSHTLQFRVRYSETDQMQTIDNHIVQAAGLAPVADGYTIHALVSTDTGRPVRAPDWVLQLLETP